jgi:hypothetical protein
MRVVASGPRLGLRLAEQLGQAARAERLLAQQALGALDVATADDDVDIVEAAQARLAVDMGATTGCP